MSGVLSRGPVGYLLAASPDGVEFRDPQGAYTMTISPGWNSLPGVIAKEIEAWSVGEMVEGFAPNVNVINQEFPGATPAEYIEFSRDAGAGIKIDRAEVVTLAPGVDAARFVMSQRVDGTVLKSLAIAVTGRDTAVGATLTARAADFDRLVREVEPYLRTLRLAAP